MALDLDVSRVFGSCFGEFSLGSEEFFFSLCFFSSRDIESQCKIGRETDAAVDHDRQDSTAKKFDQKRNGIPDKALPASLAKWCGMAMNDVWCAALLASIIIR